MQEKRILLLEYLKNIKRFIINTKLVEETMNPMKSIILAIIISLASPLLLAEGGHDHGHGGHDHSHAHGQIQAPKGGVAPIGRAACGWSAFVELIVTPKYCVETVTGTDKRSSKSIVSGNVPVADSQAASSTYQVV